MKYNASNFINLIPDPGHVKLFKLEQMAPDLWQSFTQDKRNQRAYQQWQKLGITDAQLEKAVSCLTSQKVQYLLKERGYAKITLNSADRDPFVESEHAFLMEFSFAMVWADFIAKKNTLPSESEYITHWSLLNANSIADNIVPRWENPELQIGPLTCAAYMQDALNSYKKIDVPPTFYASQIPSKIKRGAIYRAKKFYAAAMREMCALYELVSDEYEDLPTPPTVWWHPILDIVFKADGIGLGNSANSKPLAIAIYLDSWRSDCNIERKAQNELFNEIHEMPIALRGEKDEIFLPHENDIETTRKALDRGVPKKRYYDAAKNGNVLP